MKSMRVARAWAIAALVALTGCSGSSTTVSESASVVTVGATTSGVDPPTQPTTTTESIATVIPETTSTASTASTTTVPVESQVSADYRTLYDAYWVCLRAPAACDPSALTASVGPARAALTKTVTDLVSGGLFVGSEDSGYVVVESVAIVGSTSATVSSCWWDTGVLYGPPTNAGGAPGIINNLQVASRFATTMAFENGRWMMSEETRTDRVEGRNTCPPES
jgi:hypothetical protein